MAPIQTRFVFGLDHVKPNARDVLTLAPGRIAGIAPGSRACVRKKLDGNEDAIGYARFEDGLELLFLADSHFGAMPATLAVSRCHERFAAATGSLTRRLFLAHLALDDEIRAEKRRQPDRLHAGCGTTLITVAAVDGRAALCSTGDSLAFVAREGRVRECAELVNGLFLGERAPNQARFRGLLEDRGWLDPDLPADRRAAAYYELAALASAASSRRLDESGARAAAARIAHWSGRSFEPPIEELLTPWSPLYGACLAALPRFETFSLEPDDALLLASDGIEPEVSGLSREALAEVLTDSRLEPAKMAARLLKRAGRGGDNLAILYARGFSAAAPDRRETRAEPDSRPPEA